MNETREARCRDCGNRTDDKPPFCLWLCAELRVGLVDDLTCEGFIFKVPKKSVGKGSSHKATSVKGDDERVGGPETVDKPSKTTCPKASDKRLIQTALELKGFKGSVVMEKVCCYKRGCHCCKNGSLHGPYPYLHFYEDGKVKKRYLSKAVSMLLSRSTEELEGMLRETVLGQGRPSETSSGGI